VYVAVLCDGLLPSRLTPCEVILACVFPINLCSPSTLELICFVLFVWPTHNDLVILFLRSQSLLFYDLVCIPTIPALLLASVHPPVLFRVLVLPQIPHLSASTSAFHIRSFPVLSVGIEYPRSSAVVMQCLFGATVETQSLKPGPNVSLVSCGIFSAHHPLSSFGIVSPFLFPFSHLIVAPLHTCVTFCIE